MMYSLELNSGDSEQINRFPWRSTNDPSTPTNHRRDDIDTDPVFLNDIAVEMILSPSPPPQLSQPPHSQPAMQAPDTTPDPRIASLKAIFPDFDDAVMSVPTHLLYVS